LWHRSGGFVNRPREMQYLRGPPLDEFHMLLKPPLPRLACRPVRRYLGGGDHHVTLLRGLEQRRLVVGEDDS
jgi:hypothetical protein